MGPEYEQRRFEQIQEALVALESFAQTHTPHDGGAQLLVLLGDFNIDTSGGVPPRLSALLVSALCDYGLAVRIVACAWVALEIVLYLLHLLLPLHR